MRRKFLTPLFVAAIATTGWAAPGNLTGVVTDSDGTALQGVLISAFDNSLDKNITVLTDKNGQFKLSGIEAKTYDVRARQIGLEDSIQKDIAIESGQTRELKFSMSPVADINSQRRGVDLIEFIKFDNEKDKQNFKMMCTYCHQVGTIGFRSPEEPVDWETMVTRMDGFGGLYDHTKETIVSRLLEAFSDEAVAEWPSFTPPEPASGKALAMKVTEWDMGKQDAAMVHDLEVGSDGLIYAVDMTNDAILVLNPETGERFTYGVPGGKDPAAEGNPIKGPHSIEMDSHGDMWITLALSGQMAKFDVTTKEWTQVSGAPAPRSRGGYPHTLRVDHNTGMVWYTDAGIGVFSLDPNDNNKITAYRLPSSDQAVGAGRGESSGRTPYGLDIAPNGHIWYTKLNGNRIGRIKPEVEGGDIKEWNPPFRGPRRLHVSPLDGMIWVPGYGSGVIASFDPGTEEWNVIELPDAEDEIPYALSIHPDTGEIWICGTGSDSLYRYNPKTEEMTQYPMPSRVTYTREIEFGADGSIWVCNSNYPVRHTERGRGALIQLTFDGTVSEEATD